MKLQTKIFSFLIPLIVLPSLFLGWMAYDHLESSARDILVQEMKTTMNQWDYHLRAEIKKARANINLFSNSRTLKNYIITDDRYNRFALMQPAVLRVFSRYQAAYPEHYDIRILLPDGSEDTRACLKHVSPVSCLPYLNDIRTSESDTCSIFIRNFDHHESCLLVVKKLFYRDNDDDPIASPAPLKGFLTLTADFNLICDEMESTRIGKTGYILLADGNGRILTDTNGLFGNQDSSRSVMPPEILQKLSDAISRDTVMTTDYEGKRLLLLGKRPHPNLMALAVLPESDLYDNARRLGMFGIGIILLTLMVTIALTFWGLRVCVFAPIQNLINGFQEISKGNIGFQLSESESDEISRLSSEFNHMTDRLNQLTVSKDYVDSILESMNDLLLVAGPDGIIKTANHAACSLLGYDKSELTGIHIQNLFVPSENEISNHLIIPDSAETFENTLIKKDGTPLPVLLSISRMRNGYDKGLGIICIARDLTQLKLAQQEKFDLEIKLQRLKKMEAIGTLAGGVAHDLNNILSGIVSYPDLMLMSLPMDSPLKKPLMTIKKSGEKAVAIVQDLLTLARRGVTVTEVVNLNSIVLEYLSSPECYKLKSFHPGIRIERNFEKQLFNIKGSPVHLFKTVMNLVSNAAEAMPDGGQIVISTENRYVSRPIGNYDHIEEGDYVVIKVSDTGTGISPDDLDRIFEPFYTKKKMGRSGTGLGMAVVWGTVKDHRGYIEIQSTEGRGTEFTLYFPVTRKAPETAKPPVSIEDLKGNGQTVLIVDDIKEQLEIASGILTQLGYTTTTVSSGEDAVEYIKCHEVDLLIMDMIMDPGIDGLETYRRISRIKPGIKAIIASGFAETSRVQMAQRIGVGAFIKKPYTMENMGRIVKMELMRQSERRCISTATS